MEELYKINEEKRIDENGTSNPLKKVVYNNSSKELSPKQHRVLELGLNFAITPKKFPLLEYIAATENFCQALEQYGDDESVMKAQTIRNIAINHIRKGVGMKIKDNLSSNDAKILKEIISDLTIIICPADKGKAMISKHISRKCKSRLMKGLQT